jgi:hypothetical protein
MEMKENPGSVSLPSTTLTGNTGSLPAEGGKEEKQGGKEGGKEGGKKEEEQALKEKEERAHRAYLELLKVGREGGREGEREGGREGGRGGRLPLFLLSHMTFSSSTLPPSLPPSLLPSFHRWRVGWRRIVWKRKRRR